MKKLISFFVVLAMAVSMTLPAAAAEDASAGTMRLESTEGDVAVKNASGLSVKIQDKMRLYDGYTVKTEAASYAYISLDGDKTLKLDASSEASVAKSGKKLEVTLVSGSLFFNVTKPLERSEKLNIRTSTMVTGVRGTSACVSAPERDRTEITLLTGHLEVTGRDASTGRLETVEMSAGERAVVSQREAGTPQERLEIRKTSAQEQELPAFAAVEVAKDPELQSKITAETALSVPLIIGNAAERLAAGESAARQAAEEIQRLLEQEQERAVDPVFQEKTGGSDGGSGGARDDDDDDDDDDDGGQTPGTEKIVKLVDPTEEELQAALNSDAAVVLLTLINTPPGSSSTQPDGALELKGPLTVPADKVLNLNLGTLYNMNDLTVLGSLCVNQGASLMNYAHITGTGVIDVTGPGATDDSAEAGLWNESGVISFDGTINVYPGASAVNNGRMTVGGRLNQSDGQVSNSGEFEISGAAELSGSAQFTNQTSGVLTVSGTMNVPSGTVVTNRGVLSVTSTSSLRVGGTLENQGALNVGTPNAPGLVEVSDTGVFRQDAGTPTAAPSGTVDVADGSTFRITGMIELTGSSSFVFTVQDGGSVVVLDRGRYDLYREGNPEPLPSSGGRYSYVNASGQAVEIVVAQRPGAAASYTVIIEGEHFSVSSDYGPGTKTPEGYVFTVETGRDFSFTLELEQGYFHSGTATHGQELEKLPGGGFSLGPVTNNVTVQVSTTPASKVTFEGEGFTAEYSGATFAPFDYAYAEPGEDFVFTVTPDPDRGITGVFRGTEELTANARGEYSLGWVTSDTTVSVETDSTTKSLVNPSLDELKAVLENDIVTTVNLTATSALELGALRVNVTDPGFEIPEGKTLNLTSGSLTFNNVDINGTVTTAAGTTLDIRFSTAFNGDEVRVNSGGELTVNGALTVGSSAYLSNFGVLTLAGDVQTEASATLLNCSDGNMTISGTAVIDGGGYNSSLSNNSGGTLTVDRGGTLTISNGSSMTNCGTLINRGTMTVDDSCTLAVLQSGSLLDNSGTLTVDIGIMLSINDGGTLTNSGTLTVNSGTLSVSNGTLEITGGSVGMDGYDSNVGFEINTDSIVNLSGGVLRATQITSNVGGGVLNWTSGGVIECMADGSSVNTPADSSVVLTPPTGTATEIGGGWYRWTPDGGEETP